jgi:hypothetical protein
MGLVFTKTTILKSFLGRAGRVPPAGPLGRRLPGSIAPSWSWMSVRGHVCFQASEFNSPEKYQIYSDLSFGGPAAGANPHLTVVATGVLVEARTCACDGSCDARYAKMVQQGSLHYPREGHIKHLFDAASGQRVADWFPDAEDELPTAVCCIPVAGSAGGIHYLVLVLVPVEDEKLKGPYYRRVGLALSRSAKWSDYCPDHPYKTHGNQVEIFRQEEVGNGDSGSTKSLIRTIYIV